MKLHGVFNNPSGTDPLDFDKATETERVGYRIRKIRESKGLSQTELGEKIGLDANRVQKYENGARRPNPEMTKKIAVALDVEPIALTDPNTETDLGLMYAFFNQEEIHDLKVIDFEGKKAIVFGKTNDGINSDLQFWKERQEEFQKMLSLATTPEERTKIISDYNNWKWNYPTILADEDEKALRIQWLKEKIEELNKELNSLTGNKKGKKN